VLVGYCSGASTTLVNNSPPSSICVKAVTTSRWRWGALLAFGQCRVPSPPSCMVSITLYARMAFAINRRARALVVEPDDEHEIVRSLEVSMVYFNEVISLRLPEKTGEPLIILKFEDGYLGEYKSPNYFPYDEEKAKVHPASWLLNKKFAYTWLACEAGKLLMI
jgi:hypothetical protein